jgi:hypothetical protein
MGACGAVGQRASAALSLSFRCRPPADRKPCIIRSRFLSGTCELSALLFKPLWELWGEGRSEPIGRQTTLRARIGSKARAPSDSPRVTGGL